MNKEVTPLRKIAEHLEIRFPIATISKDLQHSKSAVSDYYNGKKKPSGNFIEQLENKYNLKYSDFTNPITPNASQTSPFYSFDISKSGIEELETIKVKPDYYVEDPFLGNSIMQLIMPDESMRNVIPKGSRISIIKAPTTHTTYGAIHYIITKERFHLVRKIRTHEKDKKKVRLIAANPEWDDIDILRSDIRHTYLVNVVSNRII